MITYITKGVCSRKITFDVEDSIVRNVAFEAGCPGNVVGVSRLVDGMNINEAISKLKGISCRDKETSCPDQLAKALEEYLNNN